MGERQAGDSSLVDERQVELVAGSVGNPWNPGEVIRHTAENRLSHKITKN